MDLCELRNWYQTEVGRALLESLENESQPLLSCIFGYVAVQIGQLSSEVDLLKNCTIHQKWCFDTNQRPDVLADPHMLPIAHDSLDLVILPHTLDFTGDAHQVLREVDRVLVPEGHLVIIGFNPLSFYGLWRVANVPHPRAPWNGAFYRVGRIKDWLALLGFEISSTVHIAHGFPLQRPAIFRHTEFIRRFLARHAPWLGGIYICVAKKRVATLTPTLGTWKKRTSLLPKPVVKPTVGMNDGG